MVFWGPLLALALAGCGKENPAAQGRVVVTYWEKQTGYQADAIRAVVDDFNASQDRIFVDFMSVSQIDNKLMLSTAGGVPPDLVGLWSNMVPVYAENNALMPLDKLAADNNVKRENYIDVFWQLCCHRDHLWALPSSSASIALIWNKKLFREAGLNPDQPPRSIAELEEFNKKLEKRGPDGSLERMGFLPLEPNWYCTMYGYWFGGSLWDGDKSITANAPQNIAAYEWVASYPKRYGADSLIAFRDGFGNFASSANPFLSGRVAMELQGPWISKYIELYAPKDFEWGAAAFPAEDPSRLHNVAIVETDVIAIPNGAKHPKEAFEFLKYLNQQKPMEKMCMGKEQFTPLKDCSPEFFRDHPNPYIKVFLDLAKSPDARYAPRLSTWVEYNSNLRDGISKIWDGKISAADALNSVEMHQQKTFDQREERWERLSKELPAKWSNQ
ncbi:MAG TPA: ABC transporter substrate-binding protein [Chthoniobacteraceae bacterium]|nr:ABC transporter substrate-binding protein [Chthoniobacteraceae bacterium]